METAEKNKKPHFTGHRNRIKTRFLEIGLKAFQDYEVLELLLTYSIKQKDVKPVAKKLLDNFGSFQAVLEAPVQELIKTGGIGEHSAILLKLTRDCSEFYLKKKIMSRDIISSPEDLYRYWRSSMAHLTREQFRLILLNAKNEVMHEAVLQEGTVDQAAVYPREVVKLALEENAVSIIFVHNHPSGTPSPSVQDRDLTRRLTEAAATIGVTVHDHIIIGREGFFSFRQQGLLN